MEPIRKPPADEINNIQQQLAQVEDALRALSVPSLAAKGSQQDLSMAIEQAMLAISQARSAVDSSKSSTKKRQASRKKQASTSLIDESAYTAIFDRSPFALSLTRMPQGILVSANDAFLKLFGFTRDEVIGKTSTELEIADAASRAIISNELKKSGFVHNFETIRQTKAGSNLVLSLNLDWIELQGEKFILTTIRDITAQKQALQSLTSTNLEVDQERQRLSAVMEALPIGVAILDARGGNIQGNRAFYQVWGDPQPAIDGVSEYKAHKAWWLDSGRLVEPQEWASAQAIQKGETVTGQLLKIQRFDGTFTYALNSAAPVLDAQGRVIGCAVAIQDISDLRRHEEEIERLNHTLRALSNSNQAMLHASSEAEFLDRVCQIIIQDCGFAMVWIGFVQDDERKSVIPVASAGFEQGYLEALNIGLNDPARGHGPTGTAIRTGKPTRCNNMLSDPCFAPWRQAALEQGYASSLVLPLLSGEKAFGAINIYSHQPNGFSDEEEKLLFELAGDLSFGITTLRLRAERAQYIEALAISEAHYRTLFENMTEGFALHEIICDEHDRPYDYRFLEINPAYEHLSGLRRESIVGRLASEILPDLEPLQIDTYGKVALTGEPVSLEHYDETLDRYYQVYAYQPDPGQFATILMDITERKRAEERLAYLASFPERNPNPIVEVNLEGKIIYANPAIQYLFPDLMEAGKINPWLADWDAIVKQLRKQPGEVITRDIAIMQRYYQQSFAYLSNQGLVRIYGLDITMRKLAEQALRQAHDELEQRVQERTQELDIANSQLRNEVAERQKAQTELESSVQELQVIEEELRNNNAMLMDAQKVLDTERQRYHDLFELAPDAYLVTDKNGQIMEANQYACKLLGVLRHNLIGKPLIEFVSKPDHSQFMQLLASEDRQLAMQSHEIRLTPRRGEEMTAAYKVSFARDQENQLTLRWSIRDISKRKQAEEIIRQNALRNAALLEVSQSLADASRDEKAILDIVANTTAHLVGDCCIITLVNADGNWLETAALSHKKPDVLQLMSSSYGASHNPVTVGLFGRVFQSAQPLLIKELSPADAQASVPSLYRQYLERVGISSLLIVPIQVGEKTIGTLGLMRDRGSLPYTEDDQAMLEILASRTGQTIHNARLYQALQNALRKEHETHDQLVQAEKFAAVGRLLASITHEINNPLQTIKNCLYLSQLDIQPGTPIYDTLSIATAETNRLSNLVAQLREIYRPPAQGLNKPVSLPTLLDEVQVLLSGYLQDKHVHWEVTPPSADFMRMKVEGVPDQLKQVFLNIGLNAIDAMEPKGGSLKIDFKVNPETDQAGVCFRDTGPGLPSEVKSKLFEPFTTTKEKGLGLGLVICYDIIQKHKGQIDVESEPGQGAAFIIWLPARRE
jgi:PAS domain S-box-containing protein